MWKLVEGKLRLFMPRTIDGGMFSWYIGVLNGTAISNVFGTETDKEAYELIVKTLNRELPGGKPRKHKPIKLLDRKWS